MVSISPPHIDRRLRKSLMTPFIDRIVAQADRLNLNLYAVGGFVRDVILERPHNDLDFVVESRSETQRTPAIDLVEALVKTQGGSATAFREFHTATWILPDVLWGAYDRVDFASARTERYAFPGALPIVELSDIAHDLARRDFTINAMARRVGDQQLIHPFGSLNDLQGGIIRVLHDQSFIDDPTRIFRAARFAARFDFRLDPHTESLIAGGLSPIAAVSGERLRHELDLIFGEAEPEKALSLLDRWGALGAIEPGMRFAGETPRGFATLRARVESGTLRMNGAAYYWPIFAQPLEPIAPILARLPLDSTTQASILQTKRAVAFERAAGDTSNSAYVRGIEPLDSQYAGAAAIAIIEAEGRDSRRLVRYIDEWRTLTPTLTGADLKALGLTPGPQFGALLRQLRDDLVDGKISHSQERARIAELIAQGTTN